MFNLINKFNTMKHKFFVKGLVVHKNDFDFEPLEGHAILELEEDEVETSFINNLFITEMLVQHNLIHHHDYYYANQNFVAKLDIVNKL